MLSLHRTLVFLPRQVEAWRRPVATVMESSVVPGQYQSRCSVIAVAYVSHCLTSPCVPTTCLGCRTTMVFSHAIHRIRRCAIVPSALRRLRDSGDVAMFRWEYDLRTFARKVKIQILWNAFNTFTWWFSVVVITIERSHAMSWQQGTASDVKSANVQHLTGVRIGYRRPSLACYWIHKFSVIIFMIKRVKFHLLPCLALFSNCCFSRINFCSSIRRRRSFSFTAALNLLQKFWNILKHSSSWNVAGSSQKNSANCNRSVSTSFIARQSSLSLLSAIYSKKTNNKFKCGSVRLCYRFWHYPKESTHLCLNFWLSCWQLHLLVNAQNTSV